MKQKRWEEAAICFVHFEQRLQSAKWRQMSAALFSGMYTYDGIAIARNNLGVVRLEQGRFSEAEAALRRAIERDTLYAMPYVNLAIIAALAGNATQAEQEQARAHALGFRDRGLQKRVRKLLARTNTTVGAGR